MTARVTAVILAGKGGPRLARTLASVAWADERVVLDPGVRLETKALPPDTRRVTRGGELETGDAGWLLLLHEGEVVSAALAAAIAAAVHRDDGPRAYRVAEEVRGFGAGLHPRGESLRFGRGPGIGVRLRGDLRLELTIDGARRSGRLDAPVLVEAGDSFAAAVEELDADGAALAALLHCDGRRPWTGAAVRAAVASGGRILLAPGAAGAWSRWSLAVLAGYRPLVAYAKLWESRYTEASAGG